MKRIRHRSKLYKKRQYCLKQIEKALEEWYGKDVSSNVSII